MSSGFGEAKFRQAGGGVGLFGRGPGGAAGHLCDRLLGLRQFPV